MVEVEVEAATVKDNMGWTGLTTNNRFHYSKHPKLFAVGDGFIQTKPTNVQIANPSEEWLTIEKGEHIADFHLRPDFDEARVARAEENSYSKGDNGPTELAPSVERVVENTKHPNSNNSSLFNSSSYISSNSCSTKQHLNTHTTTQDFNNLGERPREARQHDEQKTVTTINTNIGAADKESTPFLFSPNSTGVVEFFAGVDIDRADRSTATWLFSDRFGLPQTGNPMSKKDPRTFSFIPEGWQKENKEREIESEPICLACDPDIEGELKKSPLCDMNWDELEKQRTSDEVRLFKEFIVSRKSTLVHDEMASPSEFVHKTTCPIHTTVENPNVRANNRSCSPDDRIFVREKVQEMKDLKLISESSAPWSSNIVVVRRNGKPRMCIDYRNLNRQTIRDVYDMPKIQDLHDCLQGAAWFSGLDCNAAFHQIPMADERSKDLTTFSIPGGGLWRYEVMPMGLINAPAVWSRFIDTALAQYRWDFVLTYADDILVYSKGSAEEHIQHLHKVFDALDKVGIRLKASKVMLGMKELPYLGMLIGVDGIRPDPAKTKAITELGFPTTTHLLRQVIGTFGLPQVHA